MLDQLPRPGKAPQVLAAAEELILKQGFKGVTMAAVAERAHVGKGTAYLYWRTKEDMFLELIVGNLADLLDELADRVRAEPALASADRLCPSLVTAWTARPLVRALQAGDADVLGALLDNRRTHALMVEHGPGAVIRRLLRIWRDHRTVRVDWSLEDQATALDLILVGCFVSGVRNQAAGVVADLMPPLRLAIAAMLATRASARDSPVAAEISAALNEHARLLRELTP